MKITQGTFSFLPDFSDEEIAEQVQYCLNNEWSVSIEYTDDPHPRNVYWHMWGQPMFELKDPAGVMKELNECRSTYPNHYIRIIGYDRTLGRQTIAINFIVNRPKDEPGYRLERQEAADRAINYTTHPYALDKPSGQRYS